MTKPTFEQTYYDLRDLWEQIDNENIGYNEDHFRMLLVDLIIELADDTSAQ